MPQLWRAGGILCVVSVVLMGTPSSAAAQTVGWLVDAQLGRASMAQSNEDCDLVRDALPDPTINLTCTTDDVTPFWSVNGGVTFADYATFKVGYLDIGQVNLRINGTGTATNVSVEGEFGRARGVVLTGGVRVPLGRVVPFFDVGLWRWSAPTESRVIFTQGGSTTTDVRFDDDKSWDPLFGGGLEVLLTSHFGVHGGFRWVRLQTAAAAPGALKEADERFTLMFVGFTITGAR